MSCRNSRRASSGPLLAGIAVIAAWTGHAPLAALRISFDRLFSLDNLFLTLIIVGVIWLSSLMSETGIMKDLVTTLRSRLSKRATMAVLPGVVGLLPMPAGALFSAPLVDDCDAEKAVTPIEKVRINYWFRHVWEFWWPLYPGVLLAVDISGLPIWQFVVLLFPQYLFAIAAGILFLLRKVHPGSQDRPTERGKTFFLLILPTLTVITVYGFILVAFPSVGRFNKYLPMVIGVFCALAVQQAQRPAAWQVWRKIIFSKRTASLAVIVMLSRVYGAFIEAKLPGGLFLMDQLRSELDTYGIPFLALVVIIPFVSGLTTGITVGYIGASFPVVVRLLGVDPGAGTLFPTVVLAYASGFLGMMLSPIHVCLIVTNEYFKTNVLASLAGLLKPAALVFSLAAAYAFLLARIF